MLASADLVLAYAPGTPASGLFRNLQALSAGRLLLWDPRPTVPGRHIVDHLLAPLGQADIPTPVRRPRLELQASELERGRLLLQRQAGHPLVLLHPGSGGADKRWPIGHFWALSATLRAGGLPCAVVCGPVETEAGLDVEGCPDSVPLIRQSSLSDLIALAAAADLFVGNDSGPAHVAAAVGTPTLTLFGPTDPGIWRPQGPHARVVCAPDGVLDRLGVDSVSAAVLSMLSGTAKA